MNASRSPWRWFPMALLASLGAVILVNAYLIYCALDTFPGAAGRDDFELSQIYDRVLSGASQQVALGWRVDLAVDADRHVLLKLAGRDGNTLDRAAVRIIATRPVGPADEHVLIFAPAGEALRTADSLPPGQWSLAFDVSRGADRLTGTRRLVAR